MAKKLKQTEETGKTVWVKYNGEEEPLIQMPSGLGSGTLRVPPKTWVEVPEEVGKQFSGAGWEVSETNPS